MEYRSRFVLYIGCRDCYIPPLRKVSVEACVQIAWITTSSFRYGAAGLSLIPSSLHSSPTVSVSPGSRSQLYAILIGTLVECFSFYIVGPVYDFCKVPKPLEYQSKRLTHESLCH